MKLIRSSFSREQKKTSKNQGKQIFKKIMSTKNNRIKMKKMIDGDDDESSSTLVTLCHVIFTLVFYGLGRNVKIFTNREMCRRFYRAAVSVANEQSKLTNY